MVDSQAWGESGGGVSFALDMKHKMAVDGLVTALSIGVEVNWYRRKHLPAQQPRLDYTLVGRSTAPGSVGPGSGLNPGTHAQAGTSLWHLVPQNIIFNYCP